MTLDTAPSKTPWPPGTFDKYVHHVHIAEAGYKPEYPVTIVDSVYFDGQRVGHLATYGTAPATWAVTASNQGDTRVILSVPVDAVEIDEDAKSVRIYGHDVLVPPFTEIDLSARVAAARAKDDPTALVEAVLMVPVVTVGAPPSAST